MRRALSLLLVVVLVGAVAGVGTVGAAEELSEEDVYVHECEGWLETLIDGYFGAGIYATDPGLSPCNENPDDLLDPEANSDATWNTVDELPNVIEPAGELGGALSDSSQPLFTREAIMTYTNEIDRGASELEAQNTAEDRVYGQADNMTDSLRTLNREAVLQAYRAVNRSERAYIGAQIDGFCSLNSVSGESIDVKNKKLDYPSSKEYGQETFEFMYIDYSSTINYDHHADGNCGESIELSEDVSGQFSPFLSSSNAINHLGVKSEDAKGEISYSTSQEGDYRSHYNKIDSSLSNAITELVTFQNGSTISQIKDDEIVLPPSVLGERSSEETPGYALQLLGLSNVTAMPDLYGGNTSNVTVGDNFRENVMIAPDPDLRDYLNGSWSEGETVNLSQSGTPGGVYVVDPETGQKEYIYSGEITLDDTPNPDGTSSFDSIKIDGDKPDRTLEEFEQLLAATNNATEINQRSGGGILPPLNSDRGILLYGVAAAVVVIILFAIMFAGGVKVEEVEDER